MSNDSQFGKLYYMCVEYYYIRLVNYQMDKDTSHILLAKEFFPDAKKSLVVRTSSHAEKRDTGLAAGLCKAD